jgi:hypothetical protein
VQLPTEQLNFIQNSELTAEQKATIERNKAEALERAKAKLNSPGKTIPPSKSAVINSRPTPYQKKPLTSTTTNSLIASINKNSSNAIPSTSKTVVQSKLVKEVICQVEFITEDRFVVKSDGYSATLIEEFKAIKSKSYSEF